MEKSDSIAKLTGALIKAQKEVEVVDKRAENPFYKSKYADLPAIFKEYQRVFLKHGLVVMQLVEGGGLRTTLAHESGEWISGLANLLLVKNDPQGQGSAITYMRRYALGSVCGIVSAEDDDDGNAGSHAPAEDRKPAATPTKPSPSEGITITRHIDAVKVGQSKKSGKWYVKMAFGEEIVYLFCDDEEQANGNLDFYSDLVKKKVPVKAVVKPMGEAFVIESIESAK